MSKEEFDLIGLEGTFGKTKAAKALARVAKNIYLIQIFIVILFPALKTD